MINQADVSGQLSGKFALDVKGVDQLRQAARSNSPEALKAAAQQFEALFMNMMLKSMRAASPEDGPFDSEQEKLYTSMLDQQLSQTMAKRGVGLADVLIRQLSSSAAAPLQYPKDALPHTRAETETSPDAVASSVSDPGRVGASQPPNVRAFHASLASYAEDASRATGIPAKFLIGHAALETGWGRHQIKSADGTPSHNLFGIKATGSWKGKTVDVATTEYIDGAPQRRIEKFRAYDSYADSFRDYAALLSANPRYQKVLSESTDAAGFAAALQRAGYATDPNYAAKLTNIISRTLST